MGGKEGGWEGGSATRYIACTCVCKCTYIYTCTYTCTCTYEPAQVELVLLEQRNQLKLEAWHADEAAVEAQLLSAVASQAKERAKAAEEELANLKIIGTLGVHV